MKLFLLHLFLYIYPLVYASADWQDTGVTACGPVMVRLYVNPENGTGDYYEIKINGTPEAGCVVKLKSFFLTVSGKEITSEAELTSTGSWQQKQALQPADSIESFIRTQLLSSENCSCAEKGGSSSADSLRSSNAAPATSGSMSMPSPDKQAAAMPPTALAKPDSAGASSFGSGGAASTASKTPILVAEPADSAFAGKWGTEPHPAWEAEAEKEAGVAGKTSTVKPGITEPLQQLPEPGAGAAQVAEVPPRAVATTEAEPAAQPVAIAEEPATPAQSVATQEPAATAPLVTGQEEAGLPAVAVQVAEPAAQPVAPAIAKPTPQVAATQHAEPAPGPAASPDSLAVALPEPAALDSAWAASWSMESGNKGVVVDSAQVAARGTEKLEEKVLTAEELDSIRIYNDPLILEGLYTVANAYNQLEIDKATRVVPNAARGQLDLLEEKQLIFMEKYNKLVKTGNYTLALCNACNGSPIIHKTDSYPPYEACTECKGGGYQLTYKGDAKPNTIKHLYFSELLPAPDYRRPTLKRVSEGPLDFEYDNGIFKTDVNVLSATKSPYFFACVYYKGNADRPNRMVITEIINKNEYYLFAGADKSSVLQYLEAYLPETKRYPDAIYLWEFNTFEDAYNRSIIPLHRAGVVGFEIDVVKYEITDATTDKVKE